VIAEADAQRDEFVRTSDIGDGLDGSYPDIDLVQNVK